MRIQQELDDIYVLREQELIIDGVEMIVDRTNSETTVLELFEDIVYNRQVEKISRYLKGKYPEGAMTDIEAKHELQGLGNPFGSREAYEIVDIAEVIASEGAKY